MLMEQYGTHEGGEKVAKVVMFDVHHYGLCRVAHNVRQPLAGVGLREAIDG